LEQHEPWYFSQLGVITQSVLPSQWVMRSYSQGQSNSKYSQPTHTVILSHSHTHTHVYWASLILPNQAQPPVGC